MDDHSHLQQLLLFHLLFHSLGEFVSTVGFKDTDEYSDTGLDSVYGSGAEPGVVFNAIPNL